MQMYCKHLTVYPVTVIRRASEVVLVTSGGKWGLEECSSLVNMSNHAFLVAQQKSK